MPFSFTPVFELFSKNEGRNVQTEVCVLDSSVMAIAFARVSYHSRSQGHSAVAGAAYRAGAKLFDNRTGEQHDFTNRHDVVYSTILLPSGADTKFKNRETLWNLVEISENRKNSQVAKDFVIALPKDVDLSHHIDLAHQFADHHFVQHGLVADVAIHDHGDGNPHAHIYVTTRRLLGDRFDKYKARDLEPDVVRGRVVDPQYWGEQWRECQNAYFQSHSMDLMVDANHILSQRHEGRIKSNERHYLKQENQLKREASIDIALNDPDSVLNLLATKHAVFSDRDIALLLHKNTDSKDDFDSALFQVKAHPELLSLGPGDDGRDRYTTRANYEREATMADTAIALTQQHTHPVNQIWVSQAVKKFSLNPEQAEALSHIAHTGNICAVVGRAGTGKSYMMKAAHHMWHSSHYRVRGMAISGIAAKGLEADSGIPSHTIHSIKMQLLHGKLEIQSNDVWVMDEAGMTDLNDLAFIVEKIKAAGAKLVLVGDHAQLQPIGPGAPFRAIVEHIGFAELNHIQRQHNPQDQAASIALSKGDVNTAIDYYHSQNQIHLNQDENNTAINQLISHWSKDIIPENIHQRLILAHRNSDVDELNQVARQALFQNGYLEANVPRHTVQNKNGPIALSPGERILFLKNSKALGVSNGEFATVVAIKNHTITVKRDKDINKNANNKPPTTLTFSTDDYNHFNYGYAATVHKSQGTTVDHTYVYAGGKAWDRYLAYVAMTRHRKTLNLYADQSQFQSMDKLKATLSRAPIKDSVLDWPLSYAIRRGFDPESIIGKFIEHIGKLKQSIQDKWLFITNYAVYKTQQQHKQHLQTKAQQRENAKKVALFVDLRNNLTQQARLMQQDLKPKQNFYQHHDYEHYYEQTLLRNQLAHELNQHYPDFEHTLIFNRINKTSLEKFSNSHENAVRVEAYVNHRQNSHQNTHSDIQHHQGKANIHTLAKTIESDLSNHFAHLKYFAKKSNIPPQRILQNIHKHAEALPPKEVKIDWLSEEYNQEFDNLKKSTDTKIGYLVRFRELLKTTQSLSKINSYNRQLESLGYDLTRYQTKSSQLNKLAPKLTLKLTKFANFKAKEQNLGREF